MLLTFRFWSLGLWVHFGSWSKRTDDFLAALISFSSSLQNGLPGCCRCCRGLYSDFVEPQRRLEYLGKPFKLGSFARHPCVSNSPYGCWAAQFSLTCEFGCNEINFRRKLSIKRCLVMNPSVLQGHHQKTVWWINLYKKTQNEPKYMDACLYFIWNDLNTSRSS